MPPQTFENYSEVHCFKCGSNFEECKCNHLEDQINVPMTENEIVDQIILNLSTIRQLTESNIRKPSSKFDIVPNIFFGCVKFFLFFFSSMFIFAVTSETIYGRESILKTISENWKEASFAIIIFVVCNPIWNVPDIVLTKIARSEMLDSIIRFFARIYIKNFMLNESQRESLTDEMINLLEILTIRSAFTKIDSFFNMDPIDLISFKNFLYLIKIIAFILSTLMLYHAATILYDSDDRLDCICRFWKINCYLIIFGLLFQSDYFYSRYNL